jgi:hypothetical protein|tara:strand:- start:140 stop:376 length:237 start_codon:yes stop_codon:yes gene_type:complete
MFLKNIMSKKSVPQSYKPVVEAPEVIEIFSRLTLHHQTALLRLVSRNLQLEINGQTTMGYDMDFEVDGAMIKGTETLD